MQWYFDEDSFLLSYFPFHNFGDFDSGGHRSQDTLHYTQDTGHYFDKEVGRGRDTN
jgi:hypothetical protein